MWPKVAIVVQTLLLALAFAVTASVAQPAAKGVPFISISAGARTEHPRTNHLYLARRLAATEPWQRWLTPHARRDVRHVNFQRYGVVLALRLQRSSGLRITRLVRASQTLGVRIAVAKPPAPDPTILTLGAYHVVAIQKRYLEGISRLVVTRVTGGNRGSAPGPAFGNVPRGLGA